MKFMRFVCSKCGKDFKALGNGVLYETDNFTGRNINLVCSDCAKDFLDKWTVKHVEVCSEVVGGCIQEFANITFQDGRQEKARYTFINDTVRLISCNMPDFVDAQLNEGGIE